MWQDRGVQNGFRTELAELELDTQSENTLVRNAHPLEKTPITLAGLRMFKEHGIPLKGRQMGSVTRGKIFEALDRTSMEVDRVSYPTTKLETDQMVENGFIEKV